MDMFFLSQKRIFIYIFFFIFCFPGGKTLGPSQKQAQNELWKTLKRTTILLRQKYYLQNCWQTIRIQIYMWFRYPIRVSPRKILFGYWSYSIQTFRWWISLEKIWKHLKLFSTLFGYENFEDFFFSLHRVAKNMCLFCDLCAISHEKIK